MDIETKSSISAEAEVKKYTLVGDDIYVRRYTNDTVPEWYRSLISDIIAGDNSITDLDAAIAYINSWKPGYDVSIASLQNGSTLVDTKLETLKTSNDIMSAGIGQLWTTKVDAASAQAIARNTVGSYFEDGTAGGWFNNQISTYASNIEANAYNVSTLAAVLDGVSASVDTVESVLVTGGNGIIISSATAPTLITHPTLKKYDIWLNTVTGYYKLWDGGSWIDSPVTSVQNIISTIIPSLESQLDGVLDTWFYEGVPTLLNAPAVDWVTPTDLVNHVGDLYYDSLTGKAYRFLYNDPNYVWVEIADTDVATALARASEALATADGKASIYYGDVAPTVLLYPNLQTGDAWVNATSKITKVWNGTAWVDITNTDAHTAYNWAAKSVKVLHGADGSTMGFQLISAGSTGAPTTAERSMTVVSDTFKVVSPSSVVWNAATEQFDISVTAKAPFSVDTVNGDISFNGRVTFDNFSPEQQPISFAGTWNTLAEVPMVGIADGHEVYIRGIGYYVYDGTTWNLRVGTTYLTIIESTNGDTFRVGLAKTTRLIAHVFSNGEEVTDLLSAADFRWRRVSDDAAGDIIWNSLYSAGYKVIDVTIDDIDSRATFFCDIIT